MTGLASITLREAFEVPELLAGAIPGLTWFAWRVLLIACMGEALTDEEREIFRALTGREREPLARIEEFWAVIGRRGGKSRAMAVLIVYLALFVDCSAVLASGERPIVLCVAQSVAQARVVLDYVSGILRAAPLLAGEILRQSSDTIALRNGVSIEVRPSNFRGLRGLTTIAVVCDEIAFWHDDSGSSRNPDSEILTSIRPSLATTRGPLICISSPYARRGELWSTYQRDFGPQGDPLVLVAQGASRDLNPSLPQSVVDRAMERDAASANAEYMAQFRTDLESFVNREAVDACVSRGVFERLPLPDVRYFGFVDPSGGSADSFTLAIAHDDNGRAVLDLVRETKPPFSPEAVAAEFAQDLRRYGVATVTGDAYAGEWPREQFRKSGVAYETSERTKSELYLEMLPLINSGKVDLLDDKRMLAQLCGLERRTARSGKDSVDHAPNAHDDAINSVAGALVLASVRVADMEISEEALRQAAMGPYRGRGRFGFRDRSHLGPYDR